MDTIFALATGRAKAGVAVFRISGPRAHQAVRDLTGGLPPARRASLRRLVRDGLILDEALVLIFDAEASFTGEPVAELQVHGSRAVIQAVSESLGAMAGVRLAEPGEFTRRALENGRLDLAQVEGLADLIDAETEAQRRQAMLVLQGVVGDRAAGWRRDLIRATALIEATIDFAEEDVPVDVRPEVLDLLDALLTGLRREIAGGRVAERIRDGFEVAIVGRPNVGKSTLLNALAGREAAITSEIAGTTRDVIEVRMDLAGIPVTLLDTAGLRDTEDAVEKIGVARARARAEAADLRVFLLDRVDEVPDVAEKAGDIRVLGKADLRDESLMTEGAVSGETGIGVEWLVGRIAAALEDRVAGAGIMTRERHRLALERAVSALESARVEVMRPHWQPEVAAADLWVGIRALDMLVGRLDVEELLGEIFASFCIGK